MKEFESIKEFYKPIQPTVKAGKNGVVYQETRPDSKIENFVFCFWQLKTAHPLNEAFVYKVVSDGCIDIFFDHNLPDENFVMGFCRKYTEFPLGKEFDYIGVRFLPSAFPLLFGINAKELSNQDRELKQVLPDLSEWISQNIDQKLPFARIVKTLNDKLTKVIEGRRFNYDLRFFRALNLIFIKKGFLETESDLKTGLSPRQLRRIFNYYIGTTPKAFSKVVRFQHILNANPTYQSLKEDKIFYDAGFYDQAHFIKDFKNFYGLTPTEAFQ